MAIALGASMLFVFAVVVALLTLVVPAPYRSATVFIATWAVLALVSFTVLIGVTSKSFSTNERSRQGKSS